MGGFSVKKVGILTGSSPSYLNESELTKKELHIAREIVDRIKEKNLEMDLIAIRENIARVGEVIGSIESDDMEFDYNPTSGKIVVSMNTKDPKAGGEGDSLPSMEGKLPGMALVLERIDPEDEESPLVADWGYVRLVDDTEL